MKVKTPKVSFVLPVRNCEAYLSKTIKSIVGQNLRDIELIVFDDFSNDSSISVIRFFEKKDPRIRVFQTSEHLGAGFCRNEGNKYAEAKIICVCDAGDVNHPNRAGVTYDYFKKHPQVDIFASGVAVIDVLYNDLYQEFPRFTGNKGEKPSLSHPTMAYRKKVTERIHYRTESVHTDQYERFILEANDFGFKFGFTNSIFVKKLLANDKYSRDLVEARRIKRKIYEDYGIPIPVFLKEY